MTNLRTHITDIRYSTPKGWAVIETQDGTVTGTILNSMGRGTSIEARGEYEDNPRYGQQFKAQQIKEIAPYDKQSLKRFLIYKCRALLPEIDNLFTHTDDAYKVLDYLHVFRDKSRRLVEKQLNRLLHVSQSLEECIDFIEGTGVPASCIEELVQRWENDETGNALGPPMDILTQDPYAMIGVIKNVGFGRADALAQKAGLEPDCPQRLRAAIIRTLQDIEETGNTCLPKHTVVHSAGKLLGLPEEGDIDFDDTITDLIKIGAMKAKGSSYAEPSIFAAEKYIAERITYLSGLPDMEPPELEATKPDWLSPDQEEAVETIVDSRVSILTGGPGTGKTTISKIAVEWAQLNGKYVGLCAPTGRAAARMTELIGVEAYTIHRMLAWKWNNPNNRWGFPFSYNEQMKLPYEFVLVDESSMIDARLMCSLIEACEEDCQLVLVGDADQIPSVGAGEVFHCIADSGTIPVAWLTRIHRQAGDSLIPEVCQAINFRSQYIVGDGGKQGGDMFHIEVKQSTAVVNSVLKLFTQLLPEQRGFDMLNDIYVLCPRRNPGDSNCLVSTNVINPALQSIINPDSFRLTGENAQEDIRVGDRVMHTKNNYDKEVWNGDIGLVTRDSEIAREVVVEFHNGKELSIATKDLELAYAMSVHKSQGGEFPCVIIAVHEDQGSLLNKKLIYTAVSRATKMCCIVGSRTAMNNAVRRGEKGRLTLLKSLMQDAAKDAVEVATVETD